MFKLSLVSNFPYTICKILKLEVSHNKENEQTNIDEFKGELLNMIGARWLLRNTW
jgi:hypothetical protein